jgi:hypothetical protein
VGEWGKGGRGWGWERRGGVSGLDRLGVRALEVEVLRWGARLRQPHAQAGVGDGREREEGMAAHQCGATMATRRGDEMAVHVWGRRVRTRTGRKKI